MINPSVLNNKFLISKTVNVLPASQVKKLFSGLDKIKSYRSHLKAIESTKLFSRDMFEYISDSIEPKLIYKTIEKSKDEKDFILNLWSLYQFHETRSNMIRIPTGIHLTNNNILELKEVKSIIHKRQKADEFSSMYFMSRFKEVPLLFSENTLIKLNHNDKFWIENALQGLGKDIYFQNTPIISTLLENPNIEILKFCCRLLMKFGSESDIAHMEKLIDHQDDYVRNMARKFLDRYKFKYAIPNKHQPSIQTNSYPVDIKYPNRSADYIRYKQKRDLEISNRHSKWISDIDIFCLQFSSNSRSSASHLFPEIYIPVFKAFLISNLLDLNIYGKNNIADNYLPKGLKFCDLAEGRFEEALAKDMFRIVNRSFVVKNLVEESAVCLDHSSDFIFGGIYQCDMGKLQQILDSNEQTIEIKDLKWKFIRMSTFSTNELLAMVLEVNRILASNKEKS